jgi:hypothetical protein
MVLSVLQNDANSNGVGLSVPDISRAVFGNYVSETAKIHEKKISQIMGAVCELAASNGITVYAVKESRNKKTPKIKSRIVKWRVYVPGDAKCNEELVEALISKKNYGEAYTKSFVRMLDMAKQFKAIPAETLKKLEASLS